MNDTHIQWASKHNWYVGHGVNSNNQVFIRTKHTVKGSLTGTTSERTMDFTDIVSLKRWFGVV